MPPPPALRATPNPPRLPRGHAAHYGPAEEGAARFRYLSTTELTSSTRGRPLGILLAPGQSGDAPMMLPVLAAIRVSRPCGRPRTRPDRVLADKAGLAAATSLPRR